MGEVWARPRGASSLREDADVDLEQGSAPSRRGGRWAVRLDTKAVQVQTQAQAAEGEGCDGGGGGGGDGAARRRGQAKFAEK